jgi:hypothetical protein
MTTIWVPYARVLFTNGTYQNLQVTAFFTHRGRGVGKPIERMGFIFASASDEWTYLKSSDLNALVDGKRIPLGRPFARDSEVNSSGYGVRVNERLEFKATYPVLRKIAYARRVEMRLGSSEFDLSLSFLHAMQKLIAGPTTPSPAPNKRPGPVKKTEPHSPGWTVPSQIGHNNRLFSGLFIP